MLRKKVALITAGLLCLSVAFSGCSGKSDQPTTTENTTTTQTTTETTGQKKLSGKIRFSTNLSVFMNTLFPKYVEEFKKTNPDVEITVESNKDYQESIKSQMSSNTLPDVWVVHDGAYAKEALEANCKDLSTLSFANDFIYSETFKGESGIQYALPTSANYTGVIYNKKLFKKLGIEVPTTFDEFIAAGKKIKSDGKTPFATAAKSEWPIQYFWMDLSKDIAGNSEVRNEMAKVAEPFNKDNAIIKAFGILKKLNDEKLLEKDPLAAEWDQSVNEFKSGNVGMFFLGTWFVPQAIGKDLTIDDVGVFPLPYDNVKGPKNITGGPDVGLAISKNSKNPELAEAWYKFLMDTKYADYCKDTLVLSARKSVSVDLPFAKELDSLKANKLPNVADSKQFSSIQSTFKTKFEKVQQQLLAGKDLEKISAELNAAWKEGFAKLPK